MNIALHHFRLIDSLSREGTLTRAAVSLHLTQSALSHQLKELERELGISILMRSGKKLQLNEQGYRFLQCARKILAEMKSLEEDISNFKSGRAAKLNISIQSYTAYHWLPAVIKDYQSRWPEIDLHIVSDASRRPLEYLLRGDLDLAIVRTQIINPRVQYEKVLEDKLVVVMAAAHPLASKKIVEIDDFTGQDLILPLYDPSYQDTPVFDAKMQAQQVKPKTLRRVHYTDATIEMVNAGLGISVMANWVVMPFLKGRNMVTRPLSPEVAKGAWYAATTQQTPVITNFLQSVKDYFAKEQKARHEK